MREADCFLNCFVRASRESPQNIIGDWVIKDKIRERKRSKANFRSKFEAGKSQNNLKGIQQVFPCGFSFGVLVCGLRAQENC